MSHVPLYDDYNTIFDKKIKENDHETRDIPRVYRHISIYKLL